MRLTIIAVGTRGDVQPHVALGRGLRAAGHEVRLATHAAYAPLVREHDLAFAPVEGDARRLFGGGRSLAEARGNVFRDLRFLRRTLRDQEALAYRVLDDCLAASRDADMLIVSTVAFTGQLVAERLGLPAFSSALQPLSRTRAFPLVLFPAPPLLGPHYNLLTYALAQRVIQRLLGPLASRCRQRLGLPPEPPQAPGEQGPRPPVLYGFSPTVVPKPPDWGEQLHVTGYWFLDQASSEKPPEALARFLAAGPPPVYVGFGSSRPRDPAATAAAVLEALRRTGQRGVLERGWGGLRPERLSADVLAVDATPHDWLFPRMAAVVHHGGAGTTAAGLRAGVPTVTAPFDGDKPFWARRVQALGAGPKPIPWRRLTADRLAAAIAAAVGDPSIRANAAALGERLRAEDGVAAAVAVVEGRAPAVADMAPA